MKLTHEKEEEKIGREILETLFSLTSTAVCG
jgi:hypothetical protein